MKGQLSCMKAEALAFFCASTIETVTDDGHAKPLLMGTVHAQLVGTTSMRHQRHTGEVSFMSPNLVLGYRLLTVFIVHHLARTVIDIGS